MRDHDKPYLLMSEDEQELYLSEEYNESYSVLDLKTNDKLYKESLTVENKASFRDEFINKVQAGIKYNSSEDRMVRLKSWYRNYASSVEDQEFRYKHNIVSTVSDRELKNEKISKQLVDGKMMLISKGYENYLLGGTNNVYVKSKELGKELETSEVTLTTIKGLVKKMQDFVNRCKEEDLSISECYKEARNWETVTNKELLVEEFSKNGVNIKRLVIVNGDIKELSYPKHGVNYHLELEKTKFKGYLKMVKESEIYYRHVNMGLELEKAKEQVKVLEGLTRVKDLLGYMVENGVDVRV
jgi:hypothetical protein